MMDNNEKQKVKRLFCNSVQREHDKKLNNGLPILHMIPPYRDYGRYFCIQAGKGGTIRPGLIKYQAHFLYRVSSEAGPHLPVKVRSR